MSRNSINLKYFDNKQLVLLSWKRSCVSLVLQQGQIERFGTYALNKGLLGSLWSTCTYSYRYIYLRFDRADGIYLEIENTKTRDLPPRRVPLYSWWPSERPALYPKNSSGFGVWSYTVDLSGGLQQKFLLPIYILSFALKIGQEGSTAITHASKQRSPRLELLGLLCPHATGQCHLLLSSPSMSQEVPLGGCEVWNQKENLVVQ